MFGVVIGDPLTSSDVGDKGFKCAVAKDNGQQQSVVALL